MKTYTRNPQSLEETRTNKFISMRDIENKRDRLVKRNPSSPLIPKLETLLAILDESDVNEVIIIVDEYDADTYIQKYSK